MEKNNEKLPLLDILLCKEGKELHTDIFYKETDTHQYLNFNSCHPKRTKYNNPYALARWICCIISKPEVKEKRLSELRKFLRKQNYPKHLISNGTERAITLTTAWLRSPKERTEHKAALSLIIKHYPNNPEITRKIKQDLKFLKNCRRMKCILDKTDLNSKPTTTKKFKTTFNTSLI